MLVDFVLSERGQELVKKHGYLRSKELKPGRKELTRRAMSRSALSLTTLAGGLVFPRLRFSWRMVVSSAWQSVPVWRHEGAALPHRRSGFSAAEFGALPMIYGRWPSRSIALVLAAPLGIGAAIFTAEFLPRAAGSR